MWPGWPGPDPGGPCTSGLSSEIDLCLSESFGRQPTPAPAQANVPAEPAAATAVEPVVEPAEPAMPLLGMSELARYPGQALQTGRLCWHWACPQGLHLFAVAVCVSVAALLDPAAAAVDEVAVRLEGDPTLVQGGVARRVL